MHNTKLFNLQARAENNGFTIGLVDSPEARVFSFHILKIDINGRQKK